MSLERIGVVDADGHVFERSQELKEHLEGRFRGLRRLDTFPLFPTLDGWPRGFLAPEAEHTIDLNGWKRFLDETEIEQSVVYPTAGLASGLIQSPEWACAISRGYNNWLYERYLKSEPRLRGVALLPVQDPAAAATELEHAATHQGMVAGLLPAVTILNKGYGHQDFHPIYEVAQRLDIPLVVHGAPSRGLGFDFFDTFVKVHALEHPVAIMIQLTSMVMDGVFELFPTLRVGYLEAGCGWMPYMMDRLDYEYEAIWGRPGAPLLKRKPSEYLKGGNVYVTCELEEESLTYVLERMGADTVMYPSDFPHERAWSEFSRDVPAFLDREDVSDQDKRKVLRDNAQRFYRLKV